MLPVTAKAGLQSVPGGGAEIFHPDVRAQICRQSVITDGWLHIHKTAPAGYAYANATMLYGRKVSAALIRMERLRKLQIRHEV